ncbi:MAG: FxsA family protein [Actinomycetota bacterium]
MFGVLALMLLLVPLAEILVLGRVAGSIGWGPTLLLLLALSVAGAWLLKREGSLVWDRLRATLARGEMPTREVMDGALVLVGGALLLTPGFLTDVVGFLCVIPATRGIVRTAVRRVVGFLTLRRFGVAGEVGRRVYSARATRVRRRYDDPTRQRYDDPTRKRTPPTAQAPPLEPPASPPRAGRGGEAGSRDRG